VASLLEDIEADSPIYFGEFAVDLTWTGGTIQCLFDFQWLEVEGNESGVSVHQPTAWIHQADAPLLAVGDVVTIKSVAYTVRDIQKDTGETGDVLLVLSV
jgi:hypothetical protein